MNARYVIMIIAAVVDVWSRMMARGCMMEWLLGGARDRSSKGVNVGSIFLSFSFYSVVMFPVSVLSFCGV